MTDVPTKVLIVDDSALYRQLIQNVLREIPDVQFVGAAKNGREALEKIGKLQPDLLTLDVQMPDMDGIQVLQAMKTQKLPAKAIMVSSFTSQGAEVTTDALMQGAFDFILKPANGNSADNRTRLLEELRQKVGLFRDSPRRVARRRRTDAAEANESGPAPRAQCRAVILGSSTGGPEALKTVLPRLPKNLGVAVLVVQHMPPQYTHSLAKRLNDLCELEVVEGRDGMPAAPGKVIIAPGGMQMGVEIRDSKPVVRVVDAPAENAVRPALDYLVRSANGAYGADLLAVVMTGMGRDGLESCRTLKEQGGFVFAQHQDDCVVYGMPKAIIDNNLADRILSIGRVAPAIVRHIKRSRRTTT